MGEPEREKKYVSNKDYALAQGSLALIQFRPEYSLTIYSMIDGHDLQTTLKGFDSKCRVAM